MKKHVTVSWILITLVILSTSSAFAQADDRPQGWDEYSHSEETDPDYAVIFPQDKVNTITLTITSENWQSMLDNMTELYGEQGSSSGGQQQPGDGFPGQMPPGERPEGTEPGQMPPGGQPNGTEPPGNQPNDGGMGMGGPVVVGTNENPDWITADLDFNGQTWTNVGFRLKGNSSLMNTWNSGNMKFPFKLDFDEFEDEYPEIDNQRFYGFKELSFSSNFNDDSLLREKVTADIFREAGVPAAQTAFYAVYIDYGDGPTYFGLYTAVEVVDDAVIKTQFEDDSGNVYKPEGTGATFAASTFDEASFEKETNEDENDYSDILALFDALHAETRTTDPETWRSNLETVFDVNGYLRWLAVNMIVQNWDTYGQMAHNYYLYNNPVTGLLTWIPWDNNEAMRTMGMGGGGRSRGGSGGGLSLDLESVGSDWPLIRFLMDDPVYHDLYVSYIRETISGAFEPTILETTLQQFHDLIAPYVVGENGEQVGYTNLSSTESFDTALTSLIDHINLRYTAAQEYVNSQVSAE
jgi:hypothetical protein